MKKEFEASIKIPNYIPTAKKMYLFVYTVISKLTKLLSTAQTFSSVLSFHSGFETFQ
jgi:hypothetical protein